MTRLDIEGDPIEDEYGNNICQGCSKGSWMGIRYPAIRGGDDSRLYVERCDYCERINTDLDAAICLISSGIGVNIGQDGQGAVWIILRMNVGEKLGDEFYPA